MPRTEHRGQADEQEGPLHDDDDINGGELDCEAPEHRLPAGRLWLIGQSPTRQVT
jgi:hypothetical protein